MKLALQVKRLKIALRFNKKMNFIKISKIPYRYYSNLHPIFKRFNFYLKVPIIFFTVRDNRNLKKFIGLTTKYLRRYP